jgi:Zn-dependent metalloprotease
MTLSRKTLSFAVLMALAGTTAAANVTSEQAKNRALTNIAANPAAVHGNSDDRFAVKYAKVDRNGDEHVRFTRSYAGMEVIGGDFVTHSRGGALTSVSQGLTTNVRPGTRPSLNRDDAIAFAGAEFGTGFQGLPSAKLVVFALNHKPTLAYEVVFAGQKRNGDPTEMHFYVDASNGRVMDRWDMVHTGKPGGGGGGGTAAIGTGKGQVYGTNPINTALSGGTYNMTDTTRGSGAIYDANQASYSTAARGATLFVDADNTWGSGSFSTDRATAAVDAAYGVAKTWDYYQTTFGRNGIFNDGKGVKSYVHVGRGWVNAAWYAGAMYYGDGGGSYLPLVAIDVAGHEMSHGVAQATANLAYSNDVGGINEANSDIMGTMVEYFANNANDPGDYKIGEEIYASGSGALRNMWKQSTDGASYDCYPVGGLTGVDPHYTSGPGNHFFYLLAEGTSPGGSLPTSPTCAASDTRVATGNGSLTGIGRAKAAAIWYRALDLYFVSGETYPQARAHTLQSAADLYGPGSAEYAAVAAAWTAIKVN